MTVAREAWPTFTPSAIGTSTAAPARVDARGIEALLLGSALILPFAAVFAVAVNAVAGVAPGSGSAGLDYLMQMNDLRPEPGEQRAYLLLLLAPLALASAVVAITRRSAMLRSARAYRGLTVAAFCGQGGLLLLVLFSMWRQREIYPYFEPWQLGLSLALGLAAGLAVALAPLLSGQRLMDELRSLEIPARLGSRGGRAVAAATAVLMTAAWVSTTVYRDTNIVSSPDSTQYHLVFTLEEFAAVLGGRTPLVDFVPQYASLLPYLAWPFLAVAGLSVTTMTLFFAVLSGVALLSVFVAFWKVTASAGLATILYLPFLSITFYPALRDGAELSSVGSYYAALPLRYFFPLLLTALVVLLAPRAGTWRAALPLGVTAGAGLINNVEFGIAALGAVMVAVFVAVLSTSSTERPWQEPLVAVARLLAGVGLAVLTFALATLLRSGALPDFSQSLYFSRQFAASGFFMLPLPGPLGLHLVLYLTAALALVMALVCAARGSVRAGAAGPAGLALLGYSSVFGLGAGTYYLGRSDPLVLIALFCAWALCSASLTVEVLGRLPALAGSGVRVRLLVALPTAVVVAQSTLFATTLSGAGVLAGQPGRLAASPGPTIFSSVDMRALVRGCTVPGESVLLLYPLGHFISADIGVENYFPYNVPDSIITRQQVSEVAASLSRNDVTSVFLGPLLHPATEQALTSALRAAGFEVTLERPPVAAVDTSVGGTGPLTVWRQPSVPGPCS